MAEHVNVARLVRENEVLRDVAVKAARLRRLGMAVDGIEESLEKVWRDAPDMTRSFTGALFAATAYDTAVKTFDEALAVAADVFTRTDFADQISLNPELVAASRQKDQPHD